MFLSPLSDIPRIPFKPDAGPTETLVFKHYNAKEVWFAMFIHCILNRYFILESGHSLLVSILFNANSKIIILNIKYIIATISIMALSNFLFGCYYFKVIHGKPMEEWLRFSVCYWHTFRGTGKLSSTCWPICMTRTL